MKKKLGTRIAEERRKKGLSQKEFAEQVNCTRQMVSRWELNEAKPRTDNVEKICEVLDISIEDLIGNKKKKKSKTSNDSKSVKVRKINYKKILTIIAIIAIITIFLMTVTYFGYAGYKYTLLNNINSKVARYKNVENYYFKKETYMNTERQTSIEIWYKNGLYKIIETSYLNNMENSIIKYLDLNNKCQYMINEEEKNYTQLLLSNIEKYNNGEYMYNLFPIVIQEEAKEGYKQLAKEINNIYCKTENNKLVLKVNEEILCFNKDTYFPTMNTVILKENNNKQDNLNKYNIELNNVKDEDVTIPSSYTRVE